MTPDRRIARIQRWLAACKSRGNVEAIELHTPRLYRGKPWTWELLHRNDLRLTEADRLFAAELAWLAEYATRLDTLRATELRLDAIDPDGIHRVTEYGTGEQP